MFTRTIAPLEENLRGRITTNREAERFILAGNATVTVVSLASGRRYTYKVQKPDDFDANRPIWFVKVLRGDDNERDFSYIGQIRLANGIYFYERGRKCDARWFTASDGFHWLWKQIVYRLEPDVHPNVELWHEGRCGRCGRKLTVPESVASGYGPDCIEMVGG